ncbi:MAG TPA: glycoside hydrolase, partial [bacterium]|nr:glycoside hydrolase [bacterium]
MSRYLCIHGHFYQPPRENAWLEDIEIQDSAYPYHDWNERITAECYSPNSAARILSGDNRIIDIINNYSKISFNFGPTLLSWMEKQAPDVYNAILEADKLSQQQFSGHGAALAQVYNHMIMPLANGRDKRSQVYWGIEDFRSRFGREPEGMWLPETAVDLETLEVLAEFGIRFTVLSPYQAARIRKIPAEEEPTEEQSAAKNAGESDNGWRDVRDGKVDPKRPYVCNLPSG